jgi:hypothetical protein
VKIRIRRTPRESEVDGVRLDRFKAGDVREVSPILGAWMIAEGYGVPEMRKTVKEYEQDFSSVKDVATQSTADDRPRRRRTDR